MTSSNRTFPPRLALVAAVALACLLGGCGETATAAPEPEGPVYGLNRIAFPEPNLPALRLPSGATRDIGSLLNVATAMTYGEFAWNDDGVPPGKAWVLVDLKAQTMSVFRGKHEIGTAVTLYGVDAKPTPTGRFVILERRKDHRSSLYDAPMPYTLRLTYDGIAIHGSDVRAGAGTRGCLGVPLEFGSRIFDELKVGDEVLIVADGSLLRDKPDIV